MTLRVAEALALAVIAAPLGAAAQNAYAASAMWSSAGNGPGDTRAATSESIINTSNVGKLTPLWSLTTTGEVPDTPTIEGDAAYVVDAGGSVYRLDAKTGAIAWHIKLASVSGNAMSNARTSPAIAPDTILIGDQASATVYALNKSDGTLAWRTKLDTARGAIITSSPVVVGTRVIVGVASGQEELAAAIKGFVPDFRGSVAALDLATGKVLWQTYTVPNGFTGAAVWASNLAVDTKRNAVYATTGDNYTVPASVAACQAKARDGAAQDRCLPAGDHIDSVMSLDLASGAVNWARRMTTLDTWTVSCLPSSHAPATPCPQPAGLDYDFGSGANLFSTSGSGPARDLVGAGQKSGIYWALDRDTGATVWATQVNPGGTRGGIQWGSAVGERRIFIAASNSNYVWSSIMGTNKLTDGGFWSALDLNTGKILWQTATDAKQPLPATHASRSIKPPAGATARTEGAVSLANGVMFGSDEAGNFVALNAATGEKLWNFAAGGAAVDAPSIVNGVVYWGDGYGDIGRTTNKLYAFGLPK